MDIQSKLKKVMQGQMAKLGGLELKIGDHLITAVPAEIDSDASLMGGTRDEREIDVAFPSIADLKIKKGSVCYYDGEKWRIESFRKGRAMTTIKLIEPNRKEG